MDAREGNIFNLLNGLKQYLIPVYQRLYSWELPQCQRLWNDIVAMQKERDTSWALSFVLRKKLLLQEYKNIWLLMDNKD